MEGAWSFPHTRWGTLVSGVHDSPWVSGTERVNTCNPQDVLVSVKWRPVYPVVVGARTSVVESE